MKLALPLSSFRTMLLLVPLALSVVTTAVVGGFLSLRIGQQTLQHAETEILLLAQTVRSGFDKSFTVEFERGRELANDSDIAFASQSILFLVEAKARIEEYLRTSILARRVSLVNGEAKVISSYSLVDKSENMSGDVGVLEENIPPIFSSCATARKFDLPPPAELRRYGNSLLACYSVVGHSGFWRGAYLVVEFSAENLSRLVGGLIREPFRYKIAADGKHFGGESETWRSELFFLREVNLPRPEVLGAPVIRLQVAGERGRILQPIRHTFVELGFTISALAAVLVLAAWLGMRPLVRAFAELVRFADSFADTTVSPRREGFVFAELDKLAAQLLEQRTLLVAKTIDTERVKGELARAQTEAELGVLKAQMNPHFLFNTLNSIASMIDLDPKSANSMVEQLASLYRLIAAAGKLTELTLAEDVRIAELYLDLERIRFADRMHFSIDLAPEAHNVLVPPLIMQTLVENAVKHGIAKCRDGGDIHVLARSNPNGRVQVVVSNSGAPLVSSARVGGIGLANTKKRLELVTGDPDGFKIYSDEESRTVVEFFLPTARRV